MAGIVTCDKIGEALIRWLDSATEAERDAVCEALNCEYQTLRNCAGVAHAFNAQVPSCAEMEAAIAQVQAAIAIIDSTTVDLSGNGTSASPLRAAVRLSSASGNLLTTRTDGLYYGQEAPPDLANLYVSPALGDDANAGTRAQPLATVEEALNRQVNAPVSYTIHLRSGETHTVRAAYNRILATITFTTYDEPTYQDQPNQGFCTSYVPVRGAEFVRAILQFNPYEYLVDTAGNQTYRQATISADALWFNGVTVISDNPANFANVVGFAAVATARTSLTLSGVRILAGTNGALPPTGVFSCPNVRLQRIFTDTNRPLFQNSGYGVVALGLDNSCGAPGGCGIYATYTCLQDNTQTITLEQLYAGPVYDATTKTMFNFAQSWDPWA